MNYQEELNKIAENALLEDAYKEDVTSNILIDKKENINNIQLVRAPLPDESESYNPNNNITINILSEIANDSLYSTINKYL